MTENFLRRGSPGPYQTLAAMGGTIAGRAFYLLLQIALARSLGVKGFGLFTIAWTVAGLGNVAATLGMQQATIRYGVTGRRLWQDGYLPMVLMVSGALTSGIIVAADSIAISVFHEPAAAPAIQALAPSILLTALITVHSAGLRAADRPVTGALVRDVAFYGLVLAGVLIATEVGSPTAENLALAYTLSLLPALGLALALSLRDPPEGSRVALRTLVGFGAFSLVVHSTTVINLWIDRLMLGALAAPEELGLYQAASQLAMIPVFLHSALVAVYEPVLSRASTASERTGDFLSAQLLLLHLTLPGAAIGIAAAPFWLELLYGAPFAVAGPALAILLLGQTLRAAAGPATAALHLAGASGITALLSFATLAANVALNAILIPPFGDVGAAAATAVANGGLGILGLSLCLRRGFLRLGLTFYCGVGCGAMILIAAVAVSLLTGSGGNLLSGGVTAVAAFSIYSLVVLFLPAPIEDRLVQSLRRLLKRSVLRAMVAGSEGLRRIF